MIEHTKEWSIFVPLEPVPKAYRSMKGRLRLSEQCRDFQENVYRFIRNRAPKYPMDGNLIIELVFYMKRKESQRNTPYPNKKPDLDNLMKAFVDALQRAMVLENDSRIIDGVIKKRFAGGKDAGTIIQPGIFVRLVRLDE